MKVIDPQNTPQPDLHQYLVGAVAPRPIAFASTIDEQGTPNLAPYSFFNVFSSNPPIVVFSSNRRAGDHSTKDTLQNVQTIPEVVINMVSHRIVRQMAVASMDYPPEVSEFTKSGLTPIPSDLVRPFRVKESPVHLECKVNQIIPLGDRGGAGHLIICEVLRIHIDEAVLDANGRIDPQRIDLMGRMGRAFYVRASGEAVHTVIQPFAPPGIGFDGLPVSALQSHILTGNELGQMAGMAQAPSPEDVEALQNEKHIAHILKAKNARDQLHHYAQTELAKNNVALAMQLVWLADTL